MSLRDSTQTAEDVLNLLKNIGELFNQDIVLISSDEFINKMNDTDDIVLRRFYCMSEIIKLQSIAIKKLSRFIQADAF